MEQNLYIATPNEIVIVLKSFWNLVFFITFLITLHFIKPFEGKRWLYGVAWCWFIGYFIDGFYDISMYLLYRVVDFNNWPLLSNVRQLGWDVQSVGSFLLLPMFFIQLWCNKNLNGISALFSFKGRVPRSVYWAMSLLGAMTVFQLIYSMGYIERNEDAEHWIMLNVGTYVIILLLTTWLNIVTSIKRVHDCNKSGWWVLLLVVPIIGSFWALFYLGCKRGVVGKNQFGDDPVMSD